MMWRRQNRRRPAQLVAVMLGLVMGLAMVVVPAWGEGSGSDPSWAPAWSPVNSPVPAEQAGGFVGWGGAIWDPDDGELHLDSHGELQLPAELEGVALQKVVGSSTATLALTADGRVHAWGGNSAGVQEIPPSVKTMDVVDIAASSPYAGVVGRDGTVVVWGAGRAGPDPADAIPQGLNDAVRLELGQNWGFALRRDGTVVGWGANDPQYFSDLGGKIPPELTVPGTVKDITVTGYNAYALTTAGTVVGWGKWASRCDSPEDPMASCMNDPRGPYGLPTEILDPQPGREVVSVAALAKGGVALLADHTIVSWGSYGNKYPPDLGGKKAVAIAAGYHHYLVLDEDGTIHLGGRTPAEIEFYSPPATVPIDKITQLHISGSGHAVGIYTAVLSITPPTITGTARAGTGSLTGTPGTFSGAPDQISSQWVVNGQPVGQAVLGDQAATLPLAGYAKGTKVVYRSTATKAGEDTVVTESDLVTLSAAPTPPPAAKTTPKVVAKVNKAPTRKKPGQVTVRIQGGPTASGTVKIAMRGKVVKPKLKKRLQKLKKQRKQAATAKRRKNIAHKIKKVKKKANKPKKITTSKKLNKNGAAKIKLKKLARGKGKWTLRVTYGGDNAHKAAKSKAVKFKVKKK